MNIDQVRERIAELMGYNRCGNHWHNPTHGCKFEPPCPKTIDGIAEMIPERYNVTVRMTLCASDGSVDGQPNGIYWAAHAFAHENDVDHDDAKGASVRLSIVGQRNPAELEARTRLLLAVLEAQQ